MAVVTGYNRSGINPKTGRPWQDATGAFLPESKAFIKLHGGSRLELVSPQTPAKRRLLVESAIRGEPGLEVVTVFGHGVSNGLLATGHMMAQSFELALAIRDVRAKTVIFYACSTAAGRRGFADYVADSLPGVNLWAHTTSGHASWNPNTQLAGGPNGGDMVVRKSEPMWKKWRDRMHDDQAFRLSFWHVAHGLPRDEALEAVRGAV
jgi:hypothetical protein